MNGIYLVIVGMEHVNGVIKAFRTMDDAENWASSKDCRKLMANTESPQIFIQWLEIETNIKAGTMTMTLSKD